MFSLTRLFTRLFRLVASSWMNTAEHPFSQTGVPMTRERLKHLLAQTPSIPSRNMTDMARIS